MAAPAAGGGACVGYLFSSPLKESEFSDVAAGQRPRAEFHLFMERQRTRIVTPGWVESAGAVTRLIGRFGNPNFAIAAASLAHRPAFDAILATGENVGFPAVVLASLVARDTPVHVITHGSFFGSHHMRHAARVLRLNGNARYLTLSDALREQMIVRFGFPGRSVINAGYGVDTQFFAPRDQQVMPARPVIASAGTANRDYSSLLAATHDLDADVRIAADSVWYPSRVDVASRSMPANCEMRSYGDYLGLRELYASAAFVVVPLYPANHACGLAVIAEAMAMGKAVITTRIAGRSDFIVEGQTGFYVEPRDIQGLRARIRCLLDDPARAAEMGRAARERMVARFSLEAYAGRIIEAVNAS